jgi:glycosyltransferase involved in cell wall biosynthesis
LRLFAASLRRAAAVVAVSQAVKSVVVELTRVAPESVEVLRNGADLSGYESLPSPDAARRNVGLPVDRRIVMAVGRLDRAKNYPLLVEASASMLRSFPETLFVLVGEGPERRRIEAEINNLGVEKSWVLLGQRMDVPDCLAGADLFAMSSAWEGFPVAIVEAMAAGLPIVATNVAGVVEVIDHEENGLLVENGSTAQFSDALCRLANDAVFARRLGTRARQQALTEYDLESYMDRAEALFLKVVAGAGSPTAGLTGERQVDPE